MALAESEHIGLYSKYAFILLAVASGQAFAASPPESAAFGHQVH